MWVTGGSWNRALRLGCPGGQSIERFAVKGDAAVEFRNRAAGFKSIQNEEASGRACVKLGMWRCCCTSAFGSIVVKYRDPATVATRAKGRDGFMAMIPMPLPFSIGGSVIPNSGR